METAEPGYNGWCGFVVVCFVGHIAQCSMATAHKRTCRMHGDVRQDVVHARLEIFVSGDYTCSS